jgi:tRNA dimethylallyltransferase
VLRVYFILGCTASGKAKLAFELARRYAGQILSVDSMKIYRGMDVGTAKPSLEVRAQIAHHGIDVAEPWQGHQFTVHDYVRLADEAIAQITAAGDRAIAVGGTHLYLKALIEGMFEGPGQSAEIRAELKARAVAEGVVVLHAELSRVDASAAERIHPNDERRIIRALEVYRLTGRPISQLQQQWDAGRMRYECRIVLLRRQRGDTNGRINCRVARMMEEGLLAEAERLCRDPRGLNRQAAAALGYAELFAHFAGRLSLEEAVERIKIDTRRFAKNQRTWFRHFGGALPLDLSAESTVEQAADAAAKLLGLNEGHHT